MCLGPECAALPDLWRRSGGAVSLDPGSDNHRRELRHEALIDLAHRLNCGSHSSTIRPHTNTMDELLSDHIFEMPNWYLKRGIEPISKWPIRGQK